MSYTKVNWENIPSRDTPMSAENLNHMDDGIADVDYNLAIARSDLVTLTGRVDELAQAPEGSTTGDLELIDGRTDAYGDTYTNIGGAMRAQFSEAAANIAALYVTASTYQKGSYVTYKGALYKCKDNNVTGTWDATKWEAVSATDYLAVAEDALTRKADINGNHSDLTSGTANQLLSKSYTTDNEPYTFRQSRATGDRSSEVIVGGSVVWNQLIHLLTARSETYGITRTIDTSSGKLGLRYTGTSTKTTDYTAANTDLSASDHVLYITFGVDLPTGTRISTAVVDKKNYGIIKPNIANFGLRIDDGTEVDVTVFPQLFDLTLMFGSTIADYIYSLEQAEAGAGVAWFRKYFPDDYYEYNAGEIKSVTGLVAKETVGKNLLPVPPEYIDTTIRPLDKTKAVHVLPNVEYRFVFDSIGNATSWRIGVRFWDTDGNHISRVSDNTVLRPFSITGSLPSWNTTYNVWMDGANTGSCDRTIAFDREGYVRFWFLSGNTSASMEMKGARLFFALGTSEVAAYEAYDKHTAVLDPTLELRGLPKLDTNNQLYFDGDIYAPNGEVTRYYSKFKIKDVAWSYQNIVTGSWSGPVFRGDNHHANAYSKTICDKYEYRGLSNNKSISISAYWDTNKRLVIRDDTYTSVEDFLEAMGEAEIVSSMALPSEQSTPYTEIQTVDPNGTEEFVFDDNAFKMPVGHDTKYYTDLRAKLEDLTIDATLENEGEVADAKAVRDALNNLHESLASVVTVALTSDNWTSYAQTATVTGVDSDETKQIISVYPSAASKDECVRCGVAAISQGAGSITFSCVHVPTTNLTIYISITEVASDD